MIIPDRKIILGACTAAMLSLCGVAATTAYADDAELATIGEITAVSNESGENVMAKPMKATAIQFDSIELANPQQSHMYYTGSALKPKVVVKAQGTTLVENIDYKASYQRNTYPTGDNNASITVTGINNYKGYKGAINFTVDRLDLAQTKIGVSAQAYTGRQIKPKFAVTIDNGNDTPDIVSTSAYNIVYGENINPGPQGGAATITPKNSYSFGEKTVAFKISRPFANAEISAPSVVYWNNGNEVHPSPVAVTIGGVKLVEGRDYKLRYDSPRDIGSHYGYVVPIGDYEGATEKKFSFAIKYNFAKASVSGIPASVTFTNQTWSPDPVVKYGATTLRRGTDYVVSYENNRNVGTATVKITGRGNYDGEIKKTFVIKKGAQGINAPKSIIKKFGDAGFYLGAYRTTGDGNLTYTSSNTKVAKVASNGYVTIVGAGKATITVNVKGTANYNAASAPIALTVNKVNASVTAKTTSKSVTIANAKKAKQTISLGAASSSKGKISYKVTKTNKNITFKNGVATLKKGTYKKGKQSMTVAVTTAAKGNYNKTTKNFTITFNIK